MCCVEVWGALATGSPARISLDGYWFARNGLADAQRLRNPGQFQNGWKKVVLPANALDAGLADVEIHSFARLFDVPDMPENTLRYLCFDGVDYQAAVWLNGVLLGHHEGYFEPFKFALEKDVLKPEGNILLVRVVARAETRTLQKEQIKGVLSHHDTRPGGAWSKRGIEQTTGGIWGSVYLQVSQKVAIEAWRLDYDLDAAESRVIPSLHASFQHLGHRGREFIVQVDFNLEGSFPDSSQPSAFRKALRFKPGMNATSVTLPEMAVALWWPYELGKANMYRISLSVYQGDQLLDRRERRTGFREITCDPNTKVWRVNGKRLFLRGTNYIGTIWLARMTRSMARRDVALMKQANINAVRVHAHITGPAFYEACDEEGLLVWQDFPLQWGYKDSDAFNREAIRQAHAMVAKLGRHPSILAWCPHNEPPWDAWWMAFKYPDYRKDQNRELDRLIGNALTTADPARYMHPYSATSEHPWFGWYSATWRDYGKPAGQKMITEFGAQALPIETTLRQFIPAWAIFPSSQRAWDLWEFHNFQRKESFEIAGIEQGPSLGKFIENSQRYQAKLIKKAVESYRMQRFGPVTAIFQFMFVEHWPSVNWGILDYLRLPKPGWFALRQAYQPVLPLIVNPSEPVKSELNPGPLEVWVINDLEKAHQGATLNVSLVMGPKSRWQKSWNVDVPADNKVKAGNLALPGLPTGGHRLWLELRGQKGEVLAVNHWDFDLNSGGGP